MDSSLSFSRVQSCIAALPDGMILIGEMIGGFLDACERYDSLHRRWTYAAPLLWSRCDAFCVVLPSGEVMVLGGTAIVRVTEI